MLTSESQTLLHLANRLLIYIIVTILVDFYNARLSLLNIITTYIWLFINIK